MTPRMGSPATAAGSGHARKVRGTTATRGPRRVSGPARTPTGRGRTATATRTTAKRPPTGVLAGLGAFAPRRISGGAVALPTPGRTRRGAGGDRGLARRLGGLVEHPWLDRLLTGRGLDRAASRSASSASSSCRSRCSS